MVKRSEHDYDMVLCDNHDGSYIWYWRLEGRCPACKEIRHGATGIVALKRKIQEKNKEIKLLRYELLDERRLHSGTKLEVAEYLAQKKLVNDLVKDRLK